MVKLNAFKEMAYYFEFSNSVHQGFAYSPGPSPCSLLRLLQHLQGFLAINNLTINRLAKVIGILN